jgi:predicted RNase H-like HicB family nuclease
LRGALDLTHPPRHIPKGGFAIFSPIIYRYVDMTYRFTASFVKEGKWYVARAVELGVASQGKTIPEAQKNLREAVELYLEDQPKRNISKETPLLAVLEADV